MRRSTYELCLFFLPNQKRRFKLEVRNPLRENFYPLFHLKLTVMLTVKSLISFLLPALLVLPSHLKIAPFQTCFNRENLIPVWFCAAKMEAQTIQSFYCDPDFIQFVFQPGLEKVQRPKDIYVLKGYALMKVNGKFIWKDVPMIKLTDKKIALREKDILFLGNLVLKPGSLPNTYNCKKPESFTDLYFRPLDFDQKKYVAYKVTDSYPSDIVAEAHTYRAIIQPSPPADF